MGDKIITRREKGLSRVLLFVRLTAIFHQTRIVGMTFLVGYEHNLFRLVEEITFIFIISVLATVLFTALKVAGVMDVFVSLLIPCPHGLIDKNKVLVCICLSRDLFFLRPVNMLMSTSVTVRSYLIIFCKFFSLRIKTISCHLTLRRNRHGRHCQRSHRYIARYLRYLRHGRHHS